MAATAVTPISASANAFTTETTSNDFVAIDATDGAEFSVSGKDDKYLIIAKNASVTSTNKTVTVNAGDGIHSVLGNVSATLAQNAIAYMPIIDSNRFLNHTGNNKGKILITGTDNNIQVKVVKLP